MFEDSTFESSGRIKTRSRRWMIATFILNGSILITLILIPLVFPDALPHQAMPFLVLAPTTPPTQPPPPSRPTARAFHGVSEMSDGQIHAPSAIPPVITVFRESEPAIATTALNMDQGTGVPGAGENPFGRSKPATVVHSAETGRVRVSSGVVDGLAIYKSVPPYPAIARAARVQGTVILQATISKSGTIENLRVISGPAMLQQAAIDSVRNWRYRPYILNGQPVEVETTVNVVFTLAQ
jgi:protein TonB